MVGPSAIKFSLGSAASRGYGLIHTWGGDG